MTKFGENGHKGGRPRGARNKLAQAVLRDLIDVWDQPVKKGSDLTRGRAALQVMAAEDPGGFCKLYGSLMPKEFHVEALAEIGDGDLDTLIERLQNELAVEHNVAPAQLEFHKPKDYVDRAD